MNSKTYSYNAWVLAVTLVQTFHQSVDATYYCGVSYNDAIASCNIPCPSGLGYNAESAENECPEDVPYCFGPDLPCTAESESATDVVNVGFLSLSGGDDNETNATSAPFAAGNETISPSITSNSTFPPTMAPAAYNETNSTLSPSVASNSTMAPSPAASINTTLPPSIEQNSTLPPSIEGNSTSLAPSVASNETNAPSIANNTLPPTPAPDVDELAFRKSLDNSQNMFCGRRVYNMRCTRCDH